MGSSAGSSSRGGLALRHAACSSGKSAQRLHTARICAHGLCSAAPPRWRASSSAAVDSVPKVALSVRSGRRVPARGAAAITSAWWTRLYLWQRSSCPTHIAELPFLRHSQYALDQLPCAAAGRQRASTWHDGASIALRAASLAPETQPKPPSHTTSARCSTSMPRPCAASFLSCRAVASAISSQLGGSKVPSRPTASCSRGGPFLFSASSFALAARASTSALLPLSGGLSIRGACPRPANGGGGGGGTSTSGSNSSASCCAHSDQGRKSSTEPTARLRRLVRVASMSIGHPPIGAAGPAWAWAPPRALPTTTGAGRPQPLLATTTWSSSLAPCSSPSSACDSLSADRSALQSSTVIPRLSAGGGGGWTGGCGVCGGCSAADAFARRPSRLGCRPRGTVVAGSTSLVSPSMACSWPSCNVLAAIKKTTLKQTKAAKPRNVSTRRDA